MKLLINYATPEFYTPQEYNVKTGIDIGGFDQVISYRTKDIDPVFFEQNKHILLQERGAGYWLWKPYIIKKSLERLEGGDFLFYCDSGAYFIDSIDPLIELSQTSGQDIIPFEVGFVEKAWTKRDALILMNCDTRRYINSSQRQASFSLWRKSAFSCEFVNEYLEYARDERILTDLENQMGNPNYPEFQEHRHDQSIFSLLTKKYNLAGYKDPSQLDYHVKKMSLDGNYGQLIHHTRFRDNRLSTLPTLTRLF